METEMEMKLLCCRSLSKICVLVVFVPMHPGTLPASSFNCTVSCDYLVMSVGFFMDSWVVCFVMTPVLCLELLTVVIRLALYESCTLSCDYLFSVIDWCPCTWQAMLNRFMCERVWAQESCNLTTRVISLNWSGSRLVFLLSQPCYLPSDLVSPVFAR